MENIAFDEPVAEEVAAPGVLVRYQPQIEEAAASAALLARRRAGVPLRRPAADARGCRPARRPPRRGRGRAPAAAPRPRTVAELEGEIEAQLDAAATKGDRTLPVLTKRVADASR